LILIVPCFNEEHRLPVDALRDFRLEGARLEICFVNDGSTDGTLALLQSIAAGDPSRFSVINMGENRGKAEAVRRGMVEAFARKPDLVGYWDADLATPLDQLEQFLKIFESRAEIEMVFASRVRLLGRSISRDPRRHYVGRVGATLISTSLGMAIYDTQCGAKLFRTSDSMRDVLTTPFLSRWIFDVEIIARFIQRRTRAVAAEAIYELPIMVWRDVKGSKVKSTDFVRALKDLWTIHRAYNRRR
jgi:glycosyltransferase involved in cell wall biosynthesis